jgi:hypothetical protein
VGAASCPAHLPANRLHKVLEDAGIKLAAIASRLLGASGRAMLDALVTGTTGPRFPLRCRVRV